MQPVMFPSEGAAWQQRRTQAQLVLAGKDKRLLREVKTESFLRERSGRRWQGEGSSVTK